MQHKHPWIQAKENNSTSYYIDFLFDLRYSLADKLEIIHLSWFSEFPVLKNLLSNSDLELLNQLRPLMDYKMRNFIKPILEHNHIKATPEAIKDLGPNSKLIQLIKKNDRMTTQYLYKWMSLKQAPTSKLETIQNNKVYAAFPSEFKDPTDAQLQLTETQIQQYAQRLHEKDFPRSNIDCPKSHYDATEKTIRKYVKVFSQGNICCFSKIHPESPEANHMWKEFGDNGEGFCLAYSIDKVIENFQSLYHQELNRMLPVIYNDQHNKGVWLDTYIDKVDKVILSKNNDEKRARQEELSKDLIKFLSTKHSDYEVEQEVRLISIKNAIFNDQLEHSTSKTQENLQQERDNQQLSFIQPSYIYLGHQFNQDQPDNQKLMTFAHNESIDLIQMMLNQN